MAKKKNQTQQYEEFDAFIFDNEDTISSTKQEPVATKPVNKTPIEDGQRTLKDMIAPSTIILPEMDRIKVGEKCIRNYVLQGYPKNVWVTWLDELYNYDGDMDTQILVQPADDRKAIEELTANITKYEAQLEVETNKGNITNLTVLRTKVQELYEERQKLEQNYESLYHVNITANLICDNESDLNKEAQILENTIKGKRMSFIPTYLNMDNGYKSTLPFAKDFLKDKMRNLNSSAVAAMFPFYNSEICHPNGIFIGVNMSTGTPMYINFHDEKVKKNTNISVLGRAGSGKSFFVSLLTMRSLLKGLRTAIVDPEGEYAKITEQMGGINLKISPTSAFKLNVCDIEDEDELDGNDRPTGRRIVDINAKIVDLMGLFAVMTADRNQGLTKVQDSIISRALQEMYHNFGITSDPSSLYEYGDSFDVITNELYSTGRKKVMPTISDCRDILAKYAERPENAEIIPVVKALDMYVKGGVFGMFDCQSTNTLEEFGTCPIINFDVSQLEEDTLRPIGMYIAMSWIWDKFVKKQSLDVVKRVICDEAWMLTSKNMRGHEYTGAFLERCARRIRKRNGGLLVASQQFMEFTDSAQGLAVLNNTAIRFFLRPSETDIDAIQEKFKLSDGEREFLSTANIGETLIKLDNGDSAIAYVHAFPYEARLISLK